MKKKSKAAAEPTLVFYKKVEWEQMAFRRRREEIMVAVSVLLLCVLTIFGWAAVGIGVMCGALHALYKEKKKAVPCSLRLSPSGICYWGERFESFSWQEIQRFESFSWQEIQRIQLYCTHYGNRNMISLQICVKKDHAETERRGTAGRKIQAGTAVDRTLSSAHGIYRIRKGRIKLWHFGQEDFPKRSTQA